MHVCTLSPTPQAINRGIDAVRKIVEEKQLSGVYGPLIENFTCEPRVFTAIEVTAGNRYVGKRPSKNRKGRSSKSAGVEVYTAPG